MRSLILLSLAPLALANDVFKRAVLQPRQGSDAYKPIGIPDPICQYPCGTDWCVHPEEGDICCAEGYACAGGDFCLTQGYCCPKGDDPATCARAHGITLSAGFKASQTVAVSLLSSSTAAPLASSSRLVATSSPQSSSTPTAAAPGTPSSTPSSSTAPFPTPLTNATLVPPSTTATSKSTTGSTSVVQFTGGAVRVAIDGVVGAVVFGGAVGLLI